MSSKLDELKRRTRKVRRKDRPGSGTSGRSSRRGDGRPRRLDLAQNLDDGVASQGSEQSGPRSRGSKRLTQNRFGNPNPNRSRFGNPNRSALKKASGNDANSSQAPNASAGQTNENASPRPRAESFDSDDSESTTDRMDMNGEETVTTQNNLLVSKKIHVEQI